MRGDPGRIVVRDYNPIAIHRAEWERDNDIFDDMDNRRKLVTEKDAEPLMAWEHVFVSNGMNKLPYIEVETEEEFDYDGVLMDENHLLGLNRSDNSVRSFSRLQICLLMGRSPN